MDSMNAVRTVRKRHNIVGTQFIVSVEKAGQHECCPYRM